MANFGVVYQMKLGILAYASRTGLGYQTKDYVDHLDPAKVLLIDLSMFNGMEIHPEWYEGRNIVLSRGIPTPEVINQFLDGLDVVFMAETPLNYYLVEECKRRGIKCINAYNYEFLDYFNHPDWEGFDILAAPSVWNIDIVKNLNKGKVHHFPVPVNRNHGIRDIRHLKTIFHVLGRPAVHDRNGTLSFLSAIEVLGRQFEYVVYYQEPQDARGREYFQPVRDRLYSMKDRFGIKIVVDCQDNMEMFQEGELMVLPRRYGGLCLPMQEALSWGIPVIMTDVSPNNSVLPKEWLVKSVQKDVFRGHAEIPVFDADVSDLVAKIGSFSNDEFLVSNCKVADSIGESLSWNNLRGRYLEWFAEL